MNRRKEFNLVSPSSFMKESQPKSNKEILKKYAKWVQERPDMVSHIIQHNQAKATNQKNGTKKGQCHLIKKRGWCWVCGVPRPPISMQPIAGSY